MEKPFVFVSYKRSDADVVYPIVVKLQEAGINIWIDKELKAAAGKSWQDRAFDAMENYLCYKILFFISEDSITSAPVCAEMEWSMSEDVKVAHRSSPLEIVPVNLTKKDIQLRDWIQNEILRKYQGVLLTNDEYDCLRGVLPQELVDGSEGNRNKRIKNKFKIANYIFERRFQGDSGITYLLPEDISSMISNLSTEREAAAVENESVKETVTAGKAMEDAVSLECAVNQTEVPETAGGEADVFEAAAGQEAALTEAATSAEEENSAGMREEAAGKEKKRVFSTTGDLAFTLYGEKDSRNQSDLMILTFGKVLKAHPEYIDTAKDTFHCVSDIDYSDKRNRTDTMPSYFRVCHTFHISGKTVCIGTAYGFNEKMRLIAKLLSLTGDKDALQIDGYELPEVKIKKEDGSKAGSNTGKADGQIYYVFNKKRTGNQSNMMWDVFEELAQKYPEKIENLTVLSAVKRADQVEKAGTKEAQPSYFRGCRGFDVNGVEYLVGTSFSIDAKIVQIQKMLNLCGAPSGSFVVEGEAQEKMKPAPAKKKKTFEI